MKLHSLWWIRSGVVFGGVFLLTSLQGCHATDVAMTNMIPVLGLDTKGIHAQAFMDQKTYLDRLKAFGQAVTDSTLPVLAKQEKHAWELRVVSLGIGVNVQVGIGPVQVGAFPEFRLVFSNLKDAAIP